MYKLEKDRIRALPKSLRLLSIFLSYAHHSGDEVVGMEKRGGPETELATRHPKSYN